MPLVIHGMRAIMFSVPEGNQYTCFLWLKYKIINWGYTFCPTWIHLLYHITVIMYLSFSIFIRVGKIYKQCLMLPYEAVQMKEPFSFHITFCAKTFFAEFSFAWIYQKNVDEKQSLAFQKKLVCRVAVEKVQMYIYISRFIPKYKSYNIFLQFYCLS